jgi:hypothetical protein
VLADQGLPEIRDIEAVVESGAYRDRTCDLLVANQALSQLS